MTYVGDLFITAPEDITVAMVKRFQEEWTTSTPQWLSEEPVRFLGRDIKTVDVEGRKEWHVTQEAYAQELIKKMEKEVKEKKVPITRDQATMPLDDPPPNLKAIQQSQKSVGEVLWLVARTRPDLMLRCARMGSNVTKAAETIEYHQMLGYLQATAADGADGIRCILSTRRRGKPWRLHRDGEWRKPPFLEKWSTGSDHAEHSRSGAE